MFSIKSKLIALLASVTLLASSAFASDSGALLNVLVRKGILTDQEAEDVRAELTRDSQAFVTSTVSGGKATKSLSISGRMQLQYAGLSSDAAVDDVSQFFLRRIYFGAKAKIGADWTAVLNYDFTGGNFDKAYMEWAGYAGETPIRLDFGLRKVNFAYEEYTSSGSLKAIERSPVTRYFAESNNGRRLGAASYRTGIFLEGGSKNARKGKSDGFFFGAAVTNPQRTGSTGSSSSSGSSYSKGDDYNHLAFWADAGFTRKFDGGKFKGGVGFGLLNEQGGPSNNNIDMGYDMNVFSVYGDLTMGDFNLAGELLTASVDSGAGVGVDASPTGFWIQPSYKFNSKVEGVARFSQIDADGRQVKVSDGVRSAPASAKGQKLEEVYVGLNYYIVPKGMKFQVGFVNGKLSDGASEKASGLRSQMQVDF